MENVILGIDTSNYTTSVGLVSAAGEVVANIKCSLPVAEGGRGLRQSDALFSHVKNLPCAMERLTTWLDKWHLVAVGVSTRPRNIENSYMPCFLAGVAAAHSIVATTGVPLYTFSHQCGHVMAAIQSCGRVELLDGRVFGAFHVSGGTTELLRVQANETGFSSDIVGGTKDLNAGQVIDRIGVAMGLRFPCGPVLEQLALQNKKPFARRKVPQDGCYVNLSGLENLALQLYHDTQDAPLTAAFTFDYIGRALLAMAQAYSTQYGASAMLFAGGVMCNSIIRNMLTEKIDAAFGDPSLSADNAVGTAFLARRAHTMT